MKIIRLQTYAKQKLKPREDQQFEALRDELVELRAEVERMSALYIKTLQLLKQYKDALPSNHQQS